jgi:nicotinamidase-related amidase
VAKARSVDLLNPSKTALLLMDFQNAMIQSVPDGDVLVDRAVHASKLAREAGVQVGFVRVAFTPYDFASIPSRNKGFAPLAATGFLADGSEPAAITALLGVQDDDVVVTKTRVGAFSTTNLGLHLGSRGIDTLVLSGISTSGVVLSTVREAADRDFRVIVLGDACGDPEPGLHDVLLEKVFSRQGTVIDSTGFAQALSGVGA